MPEVKRCEDKCWDSLKPGALTNCCSKAARLKFWQKHISTQTEDILLKLYTNLESYKLMFHQVQKSDSPKKLSVRVRRLPSRSNGSALYSQQLLINGPEREPNRANSKRLLLENLFSCFVYCQSLHFALLLKGAFLAWNLIFSLIKKN